MTESEWLTCADPTRMLQRVDRPASDRKLRLFACACCRWVWPLLRDKPLFSEGRVRQVSDSPMAYRHRLGTRHCRTLSVPGGFQVPSGGVE